MMRSVLLASLLLVSACGIPVVGLRPESPKVETSVFSRFPEFTPVDSLSPALYWQSFPTFSEREDAPRIHDVSYELRVWKTSTGFSGELVYARSGLTTPAHQIQTRLPPSTKYLWTVRARFTMDGRSWVTPWGIAGYLLPDQVVPNASCYRFETPAEPSPG